MKRTPLSGVIAVFGFCTAAAFIVVRRLFGLLESLNMVVPLSLWIVAAVCFYVAFMVHKRRDEGKVGLDRSQLNPMMAANFMLFGKACTWAGAVSGGLYAGCLLFVLPRLHVLMAATQDVPPLVSGALGGVTLAVAGVVLERVCEVSPPSSGEQVS